MSDEKKDIRIIVTGARRTTEAQDRKVRAVLARIVSPWLSEGHRVVIVEGRCPFGGVDRAAQQFAENMAADGWAVSNEGHPAEWGPLGSAAGPVRNGEMAAAGANLAVGFPGPKSRGTWDCLRQAAEAGIPGQFFPLVGQ